MKKVRPRGEIREFDGMRFNKTDTYYQNKAEAQSAAKWHRQRGWLARVEKGKTRTGKLAYYVYIRRK